MDHRCTYALYNGVNMPLFTAKPSGKTIAIVDVENGTVGTGLVHLSTHSSPQFFAEKRIPFPYKEQVHGAALLAHAEQSVQEGLLHISEVAARIRLHPSLNINADIERILFFLGAPWSEFMISAPQEYRTVAPRILTTKLKRLGAQQFDGVSVSFHTSSVATANTMALFYPNETSALCIVNGELSELIVHQGERILGRATFPTGTRTIDRTLQVHAGMRPNEVTSALQLSPAYLSETLAVVQDHFLEQLYVAARSLVEEGNVKHFFIIAQEPYGEWLARAIADSPAIASLCSGGGTVRVLRASQFTPYFQAKNERSDVMLLLEALFACSMHRV